MFEDGDLVLGLHLCSLDLAPVSSRKPRNLRALVRLGQLRPGRAIKLPPTVEGAVKLLWSIHGRVKNELVWIAHPDRGLPSVGRQNLLQDARHRSPCLRNQSGF
ncbi:hypothetical protein D3C77_302750 [compost metagenome]